MTARLEGKTALILGGTSGMGLAAAKRFLDEGAKVILTGRKQEKIDVARAELEGRGELVIYQADIGDYEATKRAIDEGVAKLGKLDVFYQVAGVARMAPFAMADVAHYEHLIQLDLTAPIAAIVNAREHLNDGASVIFTTTTASTRPGPMASAYGAAKAGLDQFAKVLALELAERGIRVNVISPGPVDTPVFADLGMSDEQAAGLKQYVATLVPVGRLGRAEEVANAAFFLASSESSFVTGVTLHVDGGLNESWHAAPQG